MEHPIYRVSSFKKVGMYTLKIVFDDDTVQTIDFRPVLLGPLYGALKDTLLFDKVTIDPEVHTLVWPNGADFDPTTLHDWHDYEESMRELVERSVEKTSI